LRRINKMKLEIIIGSIVLAVFGFAGYVYVTSPLEEKEKSTNAVFLNEDKKKEMFTVAPDISSPDGFINTEGKPITISEFKGKKVADVGCGQGRYSWALCTLGAEVLSIDQSEHGIRRASEACKDFPSHRTLKADLLKPIPTEETFDLVWCFGVLHHTGNTYGAFKNIIPLVKPGGRLFLMIYGEPRMDEKNDYRAVNEYEYWRRKTKNMTFDEKLEAIKKGMERKEFAVCGEEHIHGYFDAISPTINDLYRWEEIEGWLIEENFHNIKRTVDNRNHHIIAIKS